MGSLRSVTLSGRFSLKSSLAIQSPTVPCQGIHPIEYLNIFVPSTMDELPIEQSRS